MAIKTDMIKAYDRVEWDFIQTFLHKLGFDPHWTKLMMECISSVQYRVLLNGQTRGFIIPHMVLRQGDPFPYLFILCTETLIANIKKSGAWKIFKEDESSKSLFTNLSHDLQMIAFSFVRHKKMSVNLFRILKDYEAISDQLINFQNLHYNLDIRLRKLGGGR